MPYLQTRYSARYTVALLAASLWAATAFWACQRQAPTSPASSATPSAPQTAVIAIEGMTCEGCVHTIQTELQRLIGVKSAKVSLAQKQAEITYQPNEISVDQLITAITGLGYQAYSSPHNASAKPNLSQRQR